MTNGESVPVYTVGEEVLFRGERFVISTASPQPPYRYQLLATTPKGVRFIWANPDQLGKMSRYTTPVDDTEDA